MASERGDFASVSKRGLGESVSCDNLFYLHVNKTIFFYERLFTRTRFETEAKDNSEM